jgi:antitoxin component YwqK of YwqJK toxin-antitoxin module/Tfp pilus assembly protein PilF
MLKKTINPIFIFLFLLAFTHLFAQQNNELINSGDLLDKGAKLHDDGKYKEAIALYSKISRSDTNYARALHELAWSNYLDSNFEACKNFASTGLKLFPQQSADWYNLIAIALDDMKHPEDAIKYYDSTIQLNPNNYLAWFNKGITLYNQKKYDESLNCLQKCIVIYPYYTSAHYFLGLIAVEKGWLPQAMMSFTTNLLIDPTNKYAGYAVKQLSNIALVNDDIAAKAANAKTSSTDNFDLQQQIVLSKISLDRKYKLQTYLEDPVTRQLQVLLEKTQYDKSDKGFWMQYYAPFYQQVFLQGKFNDLVSVIFSGFTSIKQVQEFDKKNRKELDEFIAVIVEYFNNIKETQTLDPDKRSDVKTRYSYDGKTLAGKGVWHVDKNKNILTGPWEFYYPNGKLKSKGLFDDNEQYEGEWIIYYDNGTLKEKIVYKDDKQNGTDTVWFTNGLIFSEENYVNGNLDGDAKYYYYNGYLKTESQYTNGKKNGTEKGFTSGGAPDYISNYVNDKPDGEIKYFHSDGTISETGFYANGLLNGEIKKFTEKGLVTMAGNYTNDKETGAWKEYYPSSKIKKEYSYNNGNLEGAYKEYYENGNTEEEENFVNGKEEGKESDYDEDGKLFCESNFEKGRLRELKFYDKKGNVISSTTTRNGAGDLVFYDARGNKTSESNFTKEGLREGFTTSYFENGKISSTSNYKNGNLNGEKLSYYVNGVLYEKINYTNGDEDGYYISNHENNVLKYEGWFVNGSKQQQHIEYDAFKNITSNTYYNNNVEDGYTAYYEPNGKEDYEEKYHSGWLTHVTQFDSTGKILADIDLPQGKANFLFKYITGKDYIKGTYEHYSLNGKYETFHFDGTKNSVLYYKNGERDSSFIQYFYGGKISSEGNYKNGEKEGTWKYYFENGQLHYAANYIDGDETGHEIIYNEDGSIDKEMDFKDDMLEGAYKMYGDNNTLALILNYHKNNLLSYSYEGKDGKPVDAILIKNSTGIVTGFYKNGNKSAEINFDNNTVNGIRRIYFTTGKIYYEGTRLMDDDNGSKKTYYANGQLAKDENYVDGNLHGLNKYYYPDGKIKAEENWYNGDMEGISKYYDATGKLKQVRNYYYGTLQTVN